MEKRILPDAVVLSLTSVKRTKVAPHVGQFYALDGAWDRKKVCVAVGQENGRTFVMLQNVGRIYSDGRWVKPTKRSKPVKQFLGGNFPGRWYNRAGYVAVVPGNKPAKSLRIVKTPRGYLATRQLEGQRNFLVAEIGATELRLEGLRKQLRRLPPF